jgi:multidrug transporter EmrE-like cation transporter
MWIYIALLFVNVVLGVFAQISLKKGADSSGITSFKGMKFKTIVKRYLGNKDIRWGVFFYGIAIFTWIIVLSKLDLSFAYPVISANYFFVALVSKFYFNEEVSWKRWTSIAIIIIGIGVLGWGSF